MSFVDAQNSRIFGENAHGWWDKAGPFKVLHRLNPTRVRFIEKQMTRALGGGNPFEGRAVLDIGTGGGLVAEPLACMGARVTAVDADAQNIEAARDHASVQGLEIDYRVGDLNAVDGLQGTFDLVLALEVVEHVLEPRAFVAELARLVRPGGLLIMSTLNRTVPSYVFGILAAEYVLRWAPRGSHSWDQFIKPSELASSLRQAGMTLQSLKGISFYPLSGQWSLSQDTRINYILCAQG